MKGVNCNPKYVGNPKIDPDKERVNQYIGMVLSFLGFCTALIVALLLAGCQSVKYIPVEVVRTEYVSKTDTFIKKDSIHIKDSVSMIVRNDTILIDRWHIQYKDRWKYQIVTDTIIKTDSIPVPYPVEKQLTKWQQLKMDTGGVSMIAILFFVIVVVVYFVQKFKLK